MATVCYPASGQQTPTFAAVAKFYLALPATPFPAQAEVARTVSAQALLHFRGNQYSVPPGLGGARITVRSSDPLRQRRIKRHI